MSKMADVGLGLTFFLAILVLGHLLLVPPCCSGIEVRQIGVARELARAGAAQQAFYKQHHRYASTLAELPFQQTKPDVVLQFAAHDSSLEVRGISIHYPEVTCRLQATPGMKFIGAFTCTPETKLARRWWPPDKRMQLAAPRF